jgi:hypothetical protein
MQQLIVAGQVLNVPVAIILDNELIELIAWNVIHNLAENVATDIHNLAVLACKITLSFSNQKIKERSGTLINKGIIEV